MTNYQEAIRSEKEAVSSMEHEIERCRFNLKGAAFERVINIFTVAYKLVPTI